MEFGGKLKQYHILQLMIFIFPLTCQLYNVFNAILRYPGLIFVQKVLEVSLISGELIFRGAYYWKEFCISKWVGLDNKNSQ